MTMSGALEEDPPEAPPRMVVEIQDTRHVAKLRRLHAGPMEIIPGHAWLGRLVVQNVRHPGLSKVYEQFMSDVVGGQIYLRREP